MRKKKILNFLVMLVLLFTTTGCVKFNANMSINKDKSMDFEIIYAVDTSYFGEEELFDASKREELEEQGFVVSNYNENKLSGIKLSRNISNIDSVSSSDENLEYSLSGMMSDEENENKYLFKLEKGLFKNKYVAKIEFDSGDSSLGETDTDKDDSEIDFDSNLSDDMAEDNSNLDFMTSAMLASLDLSFTVNLPYKAISNNATEVSSDGKILEWDLTSLDEVQFIEFEFELYNMKNIYICVGLIGLLIGGIIFVVIKKFGKSSSNNNQINNMNKQVIKDNNIQKNDNMVSQNVQSNMEIQNNNFVNQQSISNQNLLMNDNVIQSNNGFDVSNNKNLSQINNSMNLNSNQNFNENINLGISNVMNESNDNVVNSGMVQQNNNNTMLSSNDMIEQVNSLNNGINENVVVPNVLDMKPVIDNVLVESNDNLGKEVNNNNNNGNNVVQTSNQFSYPNNNNTMLSSNDIIEQVNSLNNGINENVVVPNDLDINLGINNVGMQLNNNLISEKNNNVMQSGLSQQNNVVNNPSSGIVNLQSEQGINFYNNQNLNQ